MGKKKGEAETMEKFSELQYVRPDMEKVLGDMRAVTEALKNAADFGEFKAAVHGLCEYRISRSPQPDSWPIPEHHQYDGMNFMRQRWGISMHGCPNTRSW